MFSKFTLLLGIFISTVLFLFAGAAPTQAQTYNSVCGGCTGPGGWCIENGAGYQCLNTLPGNPPASNYCEGTLQWYTPFCPSGCQCGAYYPKTGTNTCNNICIKVESCGGTQPTTIPPTGVPATGVPPTNPPPPTTQPLSCLSACSAGGTACGRSSAGVQLSCVGGRCINPGCSAAQQDGFCTCNTRLCGQTCGPSDTQGRICTGTDAWLRPVGCKVFNTAACNPTAYCMPNGPSQTLVCIVGGGTVNNVSKGLATSLTQLQNSICILPAGITLTPSNTPTNTATRTPTRTPTPSRTHTPTRTPTNTFTPSPTRTNTPTRTPTNTPTPSFTPSLTPTRTPTRTQTPTRTNTPTRTLTPTRTNTPTITITPSPTPIAQICVQVYLNNPGALVPNSPPKKGDVVTLSCSPVVGATRYKFRYQAPNDPFGVYQDPGSSTANVNVSNQFQILLAGPYGADCTPCSGPDDSTCAPWP